MATRQKIIAAINLRFFSNLSASQKRKLGKVFTPILKVINWFSLTMERGFWLYVLCVSYLLSDQSVKLAVGWYDRQERTVLDLYIDTNKGRLLPSPLSYHVTQRSLLLIRSERNDCTISITGLRSVAKMHVKKKSRMINRTWVWSWEEQL